MERTFKTTGVTRGRVLGAVSAVAMLVAAGQAWADEAGKRHYDISAQPLSSALIALSEQADYVIVAAPQLMRGKEAPAVSGDFSLDEALARLLDGSGLDYELAPGNRLILRAKASGPVRDSANQTANPPRQVAQLTGTERRATDAATTDGGADSREAVGRGAVTGVVTDQRTGANLKGALVTLEETGQTAHTDDLGRFRIPAVQVGSYTLRISYLGYAAEAARITVVRGRDSAQDFTLAPALEQFVIYGSRSARAQALNQERTAAGVSTVISSDLLGEFGGQTIAETLRRAPGVSFRRDPFTGDGANIVIRGLEPDLNAVRLNGVELPEGSGTGRSANLGNILTESISEVTISKSLLASQDSAGTGGLVDIKTKSPLDRSRRHASFSLEGAKRGNDFNEEFSASGTVSARFGSDDNFGISASVQYRDRKISRVGHGSFLEFGEYRPLQVDGQPTIRFASRIDPRTPFPFEPGADGVYPSSTTLSLDSTDGSSLGVTLSAAWNIAEHTSLRFDYQRSTKNEERVRSNTILQSRLTYLLQPVAALNGEERFALRWPGSVVYRGSYLYFPEIKDKTDAFSFNGQTDIDNWSFSYSASYAVGKRRSREINLVGSFSDVNSSDTDILLPEAVDPVEGVVISIFPRRTDNSIPIPLLNPTGLAIINDPANHLVSSVLDQPSTGENDRFAVDFSTTYNIERGFWKNIEIGGSVELSEFRSNDRGRRFEFRAPVGDLTFADLGLSFEDPLLGILGIASGYSVIGRDRIVDFLGSEIQSIAIDEADADSAGPGDIVRFFEENPLFDDAKTQENEFSAFLQTELQIGKLQIIPGVRLSHFDIQAVSPQSVTVRNEDRTLNLEIRDRLAVLTTNSAKQTKLLPRVLANYRHSEDLIVRLGYFKSVARPQIELLSSQTRVFLSLAPILGRPFLSLSQGNPDLQPAQTHNFDLSIEWYDGNLGVVKAGAFYKRITNLLESNVARGAGALADVRLPDDPLFQDILDNPDDYGIFLTVPANNESAAEIWGLEFAFEHQFTYLPGFLSGFGVIANYTYSDSSKEQPILWSFSPVQDDNGDVVSFEAEQIVVSDVSFSGQPPHSGSVGLTYSKYNIDANIIYTAQARSSSSFSNFRLTEFEESFATLDTRIEYRFSPQGWGSYRIFFEGTDLLRGTNEPSLEFTQGVDDGTTPKFFREGRFFGGRQFRIGLIAQF